MRIRIVPVDRGRHWTPVKLCPYGEGHARFGRVTIVVTMTRCGHKIVAPTQSGLREKIAACYKRIAKINRSHF